MNFPRPIITREHGSWAVLFVPMIVGISYAGQATVNNLYLAISALGVFMSYVPIHAILREVKGIPQGQEKVDASKVWSILYLLVGLLFVLPLFAQGYDHLITFALLGASSFFGNYFLTLNGQKTILSDLTAVAGLTLSAPSAYYISTGFMDDHAFIVWLLNFLFFGSSVFYVHMKINVKSLKKQELLLNERLAMGRMNILYHLFVIGVVLLLCLYNFTPVTASLAFVPMMIHAFYGTFTLSGRVKFKKLGFLLLAQSILFVSILVTVWS